MYTNYYAMIISLLFLSHAPAFVFFNRWRHMVIYDCRGVILTALAVLCIHCYRKWCDVIVVCVCCCTSLCFMGWCYIWQAFKLTDTYGTERARDPRFGFTGMWPVRKTVRCILWITKRSAVWVIMMQLKLAKDNVVNIWWWRTWKR